MSTDYIAVCHEHRVYHHVGQVMAGKASFGYGSNDEPGRNEAAQFLFEHATCAGGAVVLVSDVAEDRECDAYRDAEEPQMAKCVHCGASYDREAQARERLDRCPACKRGHPSESFARLCGSEWCRCSS